MAPKIILLFVLSFSVFASELKTNLEYLSSDLLEGRKPGKPGNALAEDFLVKKFRDYGLKSIEGSYKQEFTIFTEMTKNGDNFFKFKGIDLAFEPISYSLSKNLSNKEIVFAGFGISIPTNDPKLVYDDYNGLDVTDKIVVVLTGDPGIGNPKSIFREADYQNYSSLFYKLKNAITKGASGIILVNDPLSNPEYPNEPDLYFNGSEGGGSRFSIVSGKTSVKVLDHFLIKKSVIGIQKEIAKTQRPMSFSLGRKVNLAVNLKKKTGRVSNIVGMVPSTHGSKEVIVIGAHMDHLGYGGESSLDPTGEAKIHNGADDNASGTSLVLELAKSLNNTSLKYNYVFALFNAEEMGLLGSSHFIELWQGRIAQNIGSVKAMLNFDMVGRYQNGVSIMGLGSAKTWESLLPKQTNTNFVLNKKSQAIGSSDHAVFLNQKIPALFFTTGAHEDYHRSSDTSEKINYNKLAQLINYSKSFLKNIDASSSIEFDPSYDIGGGSSGRDRGYGAHLGCVPEFGQSDDILGVVCMRASANSPAQKAGIIAGDILVQIGDIDIKSIYDLAFALKYYRAGDEVELGWKRDESLMKNKVVLAKSSRH